MPVDVDDNVFELVHRTILFDFVLLSDGRSVTAGSYRLSKRNRPLSIEQRENCLNGSCDTEQVDAQEIPRVISEFLYI